MEKEFQSFPAVRDGEIGEIVPVDYGPRPDIYGTMKAIQIACMPKKGKILMKSPHGWQLMEMLDDLDRPLYRECFFVREVEK